jgi:hypothetical protein
MAEIIRKTEQDLKWSAVPRCTVEIALLKLVYMDSTVSVEQLLETFKGKQTPLPCSPTGVGLESGNDQFAVKKKIDVIPASGLEPSDDTSKEATIGCGGIDTATPPDRLAGDIIYGLRMSRRIRLIRLTSVFRIPAMCNTPRC